MTAFLEFTLMTSGLTSGSAGLVTCLNSKTPRQFTANNRGGQAYIDAKFATDLYLISNRVAILLP